MIGDKKKVGLIKKKWNKQEINLDNLLIVLFLFKFFPFGFFHIDFNMNVTTPNSHYETKEEFRIVIEGILMILNNAINISNLQFLIDNAIKNKEYYLANFYATRLRYEILLKNMRNK